MAEQRRRQSRARWLGSKSFFQGLGKYPLGCFDANKGKLNLLYVSNGRPG